MTRERNLFCSRRSLLRSLGATGVIGGLAGCSGDGNDDAPTTDRRSDDAPTTDRGSDDAPTTDRGSDDAPTTETTTTETPTETPLEPLSGNWQSFQLNTRNTGWIQDGVSLTSEPEIVWQRDLGSSYRSGPIIDDNTVFISGGDTLYAFNAVTGEELWTKNLPGDKVTTPATGPDNIYVCTDINVIAYNKDNGRKQWEKPLSADDAAHPKVVEQSVYIYASSRLFSLDRTDGSVQWYRNDAETHHPKTVAYANGSVYFVNKDRKLVSVRDTDGETEWSKSFESGIIPSTLPTVYDDSIFIQDQFDKSFRVDEESGDIIWEGSIAEDSYYDSNFHSPGIDSDYIYEYTYYRLIARDITTGDQEWIYEFESETDTGMVRPPIIVNGTVYVGTYSGKLFAFNSENGILRWQKELSSDQDITGAPCFANGYLFAYGINGEDSTLYGLSE